MMVAEYEEVDDNLFTKVNGGLRQDTMPDDLPT